MSNQKNNINEFPLDRFIEFGFNDTEIDILRLKFDIYNNNKMKDYSWEKEIELVRLLQPLKSNPQKEDRDKYLNKVIEYINEK